MNTELLHQIEAFAKAHEEAIFRDIARLVAVDSVEGEPQPGAPFGPGPAKALTLGLEIARELGLEAVNCEDRIGYAQVGQGDRYLATITHLDVVPAGPGWKEDPFVLRDREGWILGRGVMDDKGPSVLCLYALKYLKDSGAALKVPVRALLGINEETGMGDVEYYLENYPAPLFCFSPDANFPLCNGEKGIFHGKMLSNVPLEKLTCIRGGVASNAVPSVAEAWVCCGELPEGAENIELELDGGLLHVTARGVSGHASLPEGTVNAIGLLVNFLLDRGLAGENEARFLRAVALLNEDAYGRAVGAAATVDESGNKGLFGPLTLVGGVIGVEDGRMFQTLDSRYPTGTSGAKIAAAIQKAVGDAAEVTVDSDTEPFYISAASREVQTCLDAYRTFTGEKAEPYTIGGGTYARHFPNAVSFGPEHPERPMPDFVGPIHGAEEGACKAWFLEALKVYILALVELEQLDL